MTSSLSFEKRFADALRRRLYPNTALRVKQMAHDLGYSEDTVARWLRGEHRVYAAAAEDVDRYFSGRHGDANFLRDVLRLPRVTRRRRDADLCLWITEGAIHDAAAGHAVFARDALGLSAGIDQDVVRYAVVNLGWVAGTVRADGLVDFRYSPRNVDPQAARRMRDWLMTQPGDIAEVRVVPVAESGWGQPTSLSISEAARLFDRWAVRRRISEVLGETNWQVERESLVTALPPGLDGVLRGVDPVMSCVGAGRLGTSSLLWVKGDAEVVSLYIGKDLGLPVDRFAFRNVLDRDDPRYAALVYHHILESARLGPTLYHLDIDIAGRRRHYRRLAMPFDSGDRRMVLSTVQLLEPHPS